MSGINLKADVKVGGVFEVLFPNTVRPKFMGMVTEHYGTAVVVKSIEIGEGDTPRNDSAQITQASLELPQLRVGRQILRGFPEYRRWADNPDQLMCFKKGDPEIPTGLSLEELLRHDDGAFILADSPSFGEYSTDACYRRPFYDFTGRKAVVRQHVTVFRLISGGPMVKVGSSEKFRPTLPPGVTFTQVDAGPVFSGSRGMLMLGTGVLSPDHRSYSLYGAGGHFAVETKVLERAGLVTPGAS